MVDVIRMLNVLSLDRARIFVVVIRDIRVRVSRAHPSTTARPTMEVVIFKDNVPLQVQVKTVVPANPDIRVRVNPDNARPSTAVRPIVVVATRTLFAPLPVQAHLPVPVTQGIRVADNPGNARPSMIVPPTMVAVMPTQLVPSPDRRPNPVLAIPATAVRVKHVLQSTRVPRPMAVATSKPPVQ
jgi:hypothetical protein